MWSHKDNGKSRCWSIGGVAVGGGVCVDGFGGDAVAVLVLMMLLFGDVHDIVGCAW